MSAFWWLLFVPGTRSSGAPLKLDFGGPCLKNSPLGLSTGVGFFTCLLFAEPGGGAVETSCVLSVAAAPATGLQAAGVCWGSALLALRQTGEASLLGNPRKAGTLGVWYNLSLLKKMLGAGVHPLLTVR